jgi:nitrogen fixation regulatory protein
MFLALFNSEQPHQTHMTIPSTTHNGDKVEEVLGAFLSSPPDGTPSEVIEAFGRLVRTEDGVLPPSVFLEAVDQSPIAISITDLKANILYVNHSFEQLTGYGQDELIGRNQSILSYKVTPMEVYQELWVSISQQKSWNGVLINRRKNGERYLADLTVAPVLGKDAKTHYYLALHRDVTEMHELERKVLNQKVLIESVVDAAPVVIALLDSNGEVLLDNHAYKKLLGDMRGKEPAAVFIQHLAAVIDSEKQRQCDKRRGFVNQEVELKFDHDLSPRWFSCSGVWVNESYPGADFYFSGNENCGLLLVANEITAQKKHLEQIKTNALRALMAEQQLVHGMRETLSGAIYQCQAPLNTASAAVAMMERRGEANGNPAHAALVEIIQSGETVLNNLQEALPHETIEANSPINLNDVIRDVVNVSIQRLLTHSVVVDWEPESNLPNMIGKHYALRSLFKQLLDNAIDALNEPDCQRREISIMTRLLDGQVEVVLRDTGPGIADHMRLTVFEPFFSGWRNARSRPGMGLTIALEIVHQHNGELFIDPNYRGGCEVHIRLPLNNFAASQRTDQ